MTEFAQQLVSLSKYYKFDGWLVNIENPIHVSQLVLRTLYYFVGICFKNLDHTVKVRVEK